MQFDTVRLAEISASLQSCLPEFGVATTDKNTTRTRMMHDKRSVLGDDDDDHHDHDEEGEEGEERAIALLTVFSDA